MATRRCVVLLGEPIYLDDEESGAAAEAITPGHIVAWDGSGDVIKNTANAANVSAMIACEREEMGKDIDVAYAVGDQVKIAVMGRGHRFYGFIASGANIAKGAYLTTDNAGRLTATSVSATVRLAQAVEDVNNSAGPGDARIRVQVL
jgi:hypothetical protein